MSADLKKEQIEHLRAACERALKSNWTNAPVDPKEGIILCDMALRACADEPEEVWEMIVELEFLAGEECFKETDHRPQGAMDRAATMLRRLAAAGGLIRVDRINKNIGNPGTEPPTPTVLDSNSLAIGTIVRWQTAFSAARGLPDDVHDGLIREIQSAIERFAMASEPGREARDAALEEELVVMALAAWNGVPIEHMRVNMSEAQKSPVSMESWLHVVRAIRGV